MACGTRKEATDIMSENEQIIQQISQQAKVLLENHWPDISEFRNGEESIKIGFHSLLKPQGPKTMVETKISFGKRVTDSIVDWIDPDQMTIAFPASEPAEQPKKRGRPKKNILEKALTSAPAPDPEPEAGA
jgi:AT hook motif